MHVGAALYLDEYSATRADLIQRVSDSLGTYFETRSYGAGVEHIVIGIICQQLPPGFEAFTKERGPRFKARDVVPLLDGTKEELRNVFSYDVKFDTERYERFCSASEREALGVLIEILVASLSKLNALPKRVKSFDVDRFRTDAREHLEDVARRGIY
jgi:hypothetical protein